MRDRRVRRSAAGAGRRDRRPPAAGVPRLRLRRDRPGAPDGRARRGQEGRQARQPREGDRRRRRCRRRRPASGTPAGRPTARPTTSTPTRTSGSGGGWRWCTTGSSRTSPSCGPGSRPTPRQLGLLSETDTEVAAQLLELQLASDVDLTEAMQRVCVQLDGAFTLVAVDAPRPDPGRGRPAQLAPGRRPRRRRELPRLRRGGVHRAHPRGARARPGPGRHDHPRLGRDHRLRRRARRRAGTTTSTGTCRPPRRRATTGSCARRSTSSRARSRTRCSGGVRPQACCTWTRCACRTRSSATSTRSSSSRAARRSTPAWWRSTRSSTGAGSRSRSSSPRSSATATRSSTTRRSSSRSRQSGETADTLQAIRHARTQRSKVLAICNTNGSTIPRESDAVIYTHAGPEIGVASTKGFLTQLVACYLLALYLAQVKGTRYGDEITTVLRDLEAIPAHIAKVPRVGRGDPGARAVAGRRHVGAVPRPARRLPGRARGGAQARRSSPTCTPRASRPASSSTARSR